MKYLPHITIGIALLLLGWAGQSLHILADMSTKQYADIVNLSQKLQEFKAWQEQATGIINSHTQALDELVKVVTTQKK